MCSSSGPLGHGGRAGEGSGVRDEESGVSNTAAFGSEFVASNSPSLFPLPLFLDRDDPRLRGVVRLRLRLFIALIVVFPVMGGAVLAD